MSDVPIKIQQLAITISNTKSVYKINAQKWIEMNGDAGENPFGVDFMMQPKKLYKISFAGEQCQFSENSMLSVSKHLQIVFELINSNRTKNLQVVCLEIKMGTAFNYVTLLQSSSMNVKSHFNKYSRECDELSRANQFSSCYIVPL